MDWLPVQLLILVVELNICPAAHGPEASRNSSIASVVFLFMVSPFFDVYNTRFFP
jgi:hypothetical protein